jgi:AcrR family transcriptional regulator
MGPMTTVDRLEDTLTRRAAKYALRRLELARATVQTLSQLGYARTSLREIAANSEFSHGVLHYYFRDKFDLIMCGVKDYKAHCRQRYDLIVVEATSFDDLVEGFLEGLSATLVDDALMHRLWYDLRAQALFEPAFRQDVAEIDKDLELMIRRILNRAAELGKTSLSLPSAVTYSAIDGLFQQALLQHLAGNAQAASEMREQILLFLPSCFAPPARRLRAKSPAA